MTGHQLVLPNILFCEHFDCTSYYLTIIFVQFFASYIYFNIDNLNHVINVVFIKNE